MARERRDRGELASTDRQLAPAVLEALDGLDLAPEDAALSKLAEKYAREVDGAQAAAAQADKVLREIDDDPDTAELVGALRAKLGARTALENLGPKLLAALESLGASPKARAGLGKGGASSGGGKLAQLRSASRG